MSIGAILLGLLLGSLVLCLIKAIKEWVHCDRELVRMDTEKDILNRQGQ